MLLTCTEFWHNVEFIIMESGDNDKSTLKLRENGILTHFQLWFIPKLKQCKTIIKRF